MIGAKNVKTVKTTKKTSSCKPKRTKVSRFQGFKHGNFVNDDFFDNFAARFGGTDSNAKNEETFHDLVPERAGHTKNIGLMFLFRCRWMRRLRF